MSLPSPVQLEWRHPPTPTPRPGLLAQVPWPPVICMGQRLECGCVACPGQVRMCLRRELSPPLLCATKYVHALRCLVHGHPGLPSPGQTWRSLANFSNDLSSQLLLPRWRRGRAGEGGEERQGRPGVRAWGGVPLTFVLRPCLVGLVGRPAGRGAPVTCRRAPRRYCCAGFYRWELMGKV